MNDKQTAQDTGREHQSETKKFIYFSPEPERISHNGLYIVRAGETLPSPTWHHERPSDFWKNKGGVYVIEHVLEGRGHIECDDKKYTVEAGDFYMLTRFHAHRYYSDPDYPCRKIWVNLTGPFMVSLTEGLGLTDGVYVMHGDSPERIRKIHDLLCSFDSLPAEHILDNIAIILTDILLSVNLKRRAQLKPQSSIADIKKYIDSEVNIGANLDDVCAKFGVSKSYAIATFKKTYGVTLYSYMLDKKMEIAKKLLQNGVRLTNIASMLGYSCTQSFAHTFKKATGMSPSEYRGDN